MNYSIYIFFGLAPSIIWLLFFLRKDSHPESNVMIIKVFIYGMLAAVPAALVEIGFFGIIKAWPIPIFYLQIIYIFLGIALTEEFFKYLVVQKKVLKSAELDEPVDLMLFMIISALGFAALENLLILLPLANPFMFAETLLMSGFRFVGATFLHTLVSGLIGYFMAIALCGPKQKRFKMIALGITIAAFLHGLYDFSIITLARPMNFIVSLLIIMGLVIFMIYDFDEIKKVKGICKL